MLVLVQVQVLVTSTAVDGRNVAPLQKDPQLKPRAPNLTLLEDTVIKMDLCE